MTSQTHPTFKQALDQLAACVDALLIENQDLKAKAAMTDDIRKMLGGISKAPAPVVTAPVKAAKNGATPNGNGHAKKAKAPRKAKAKGSAVAVKYRNPDKPEETWTGRGRMPRWMAATGKAKEVFAI